MMKRLIVLTVVLAVTSVAGARVIDVVTEGVGSLGHAGTLQDPLVPTETIGIKIILNYNLYADRQYPAYDGFFTDSVGVDLHVSGPGTLTVPGIFNKSAQRIGDDLRHHTAFGAWGQTGKNDGTPGGYQPLIVDNSIAKMSGGVLVGGISGDENGRPPTTATQLMWNLFLQCDGAGSVLVDLSLQDPASRYSNFKDGISGTNPYPSWQPLLESDLGDLTIHQIPEPMTLALLGVGGLLLRRRVKK